MMTKGTAETKRSEVATKKNGLTRRLFLKFLMGTSFIIALIPFTTMVEFFYANPRPQQSSRKKIANTRDLPEGSTMVFFFPEEDGSHRSFLTHLSSEDQKRAEAEGNGEFITEGFVAFNTVCPHLQCTIELPEDGEYICPCHGGVFNILDGTVLGGPSPRPLPAIKLEVEQSTGDIYAIELVGKIGYGRG
jgi:Rieske Fe-S protein